MNLANIITMGRVLLSPVFIFVFFTVNAAQGDKTILVVLLWVVFFLIELSDIADGMVARSTAGVTDTGKLLDPFADSLSRLSYFLCFMVVGIMPLWVFVIVLYRDLWLGFLRLLQMKKGITMGSRLSGKIKAWVYALAGIYGLLVFSETKLLIFHISSDIIIILDFVMYSMVVGIAIGTIVDYSARVLKEKA
jgi:CDP-diacylglycerol--glycerol-3-phosphate 3-phosphatidyltransferase